MSEPSKVEMIRVPREEEYYDREAVLGRDATSVFPREANQQQSANRDALAEALGARKFISETELASIKATRGGTVDDGSIAADKPLAQILAERKAEKDAAFQEQWKQMKTGKNRGLDSEEADFIDGVRRLQTEQELKVRQQETAEVEAFREAVRAAAAATAAATAQAEGGGGGDGLDLLLPSAASEGSKKEAEALQQQQQQRRQEPAKKPQPLLKPVIKIIPKGKRPAAGGGEGSGGGGGPGARSAGSGGEQKQQWQEDGVAKRQRAAEEQKGSARRGSEDGASGSEGGGLAGLLGGYGSDSEGGSDS